MLTQFTTYRILRAFFDSPTHKFQLRELCRLTNLGLPTVKNHVGKLVEAGLVKKQKNGVYDGYVATMTLNFKIYKRMDLQLRLHKSGLLDFLEHNLVPDAVVLFGSASRGEDVENSDIDLLVVATEKTLNLTSFEKKLKRKISIHFEPEPTKLPKELLNTIVNGVVILGDLEVFQ